MWIGFRVPVFFLVALLGAAYFAGVYSALSAKGCAPYVERPPRFLPPAHYTLPPPPIRTPFPDHQQ